MVILTACLLLAAVPAWAGRTVTVTPVDQEVLSIGQSQLGAPACRLGNLNPAAWAIKDFILGAETYKYLFDADQAACSCPDGFQVDQVHIYMQFGAEDVPVSFVCNVDFEEALPGDTGECHVPGPAICTSPDYTVTIPPSPGLYDIALPLPDDCPCAYFGYKYALGINILTAFANSPDAVTDTYPVGCTSYNYFGSGWDDLNDYGFPGELIMFVDVLCCYEPVSRESQTWGGVKGMFR